MGSELKKKGGKEMRNGKGKMEIESKWGVS